MSISEDGERMLWVNNGTLMEFPRPSRTIFGRLIHLTSNPMVDQTTLDVLPLTQDGGNCSDIKVPLLSTKEEKLWRSKETLIKKTETLE